MTPKTPDDDALGARPRPVINPGVALTAPIVPKTIEVIDNEYEVDEEPTRAQQRAKAEREAHAANEPVPAEGTPSQGIPAHGTVGPDTGGAPSDRGADPHPDESSAGAGAEMPSSPTPSGDERPSTAGIPAEPPSAWAIMARLFKARLSPTNMLVGVLCALLGFAVVVQIRQTRDESLSTLRQSDLVRLLDEVTQRAGELESSATELRATRTELQTGSKDNEAALEIALQRAKTQGILSGRLPAEGPGVSISVIPGDSDIRPSALFTILEELRNAGAEAIEVNGIRIVASSHFLDSPQGVVLDSHTLTKPYVWTAIGNPDTLAPALEIPGGAMASVRTAGGTGTIKSQELVHVSTVREPVEAQYARPIPPDETP